MKLQWSRSFSMGIAGMVVLIGCLSYVNVYWYLGSCHCESAMETVDDVALWLTREWTRAFEDERPTVAKMTPLIEFKSRKEVDPTRPALSLSLTKKSLDRFDPWGKYTEITVWDLYPPQANCPDMVRIGIAGDGGKWVCGTRWLKKMKANTGRRCLMYSFGVNLDISFEMELQELGGCEIHAFDPSVGKVPQVKDWPPSRASMRTKGVTFHKLALWNETGSNKVFGLAMTLQDIMFHLNHSYVDVLKVDIEGAEWNVFKHLFRNIGNHYRADKAMIRTKKNSTSESAERNLIPVDSMLATSISSGQLAPWTLPFGQISIELHYSTMAEAEVFFTNMFRSGYLSISREVNLMPVAYGKPPLACEYTFINPNLFFLEDAAGRPPALQSVPRPLNTEFHRPVKAVIYFLSQRKRLSMLREALELLYENFWLDYGRHYPVVIFQDDIEAAGDQSFLQQAVPLMKLRFIRIEMRIPRNLDPKLVPNRTVCDPTHSTIGYRHMCRFHSTVAHELLDKHGFRDVEYIMRLDDDSRLTVPVGYDLFHYMKLNNKRYGFVRSIKENVECVAGLWDLAGDFMNRSVANLRINRTEVFFDKWPENLVIFNNFEISHVSVWRNPVWKAFMSEVDDAGGIYMHRWGDAPIHTIGISLILRVDEVHSFNDIGYYHHMLNQTARGLPPPDMDPFDTVVCVYYDRWICSSDNSTNSTNATFALTAPAWGTAAVSKQQHFFHRIGGVASTSHFFARGSSMPLLDLVKGDQRGVLYTFTMEGRESELAASLLSLYNGFTKQFQYPIVVFYSSRSSPRFDRAAVTHTIGKQLSGSVMFVGVDTFPYYPKEQWANLSKYTCSSHSPEMTAIVKFLKFDAIERLSHMGYEWFFRFDESSSFAKPLTYDIFQSLAQDGKRVGFLNVVLDRSSCWQQALETINLLCYGSIEGVAHQNPKNVPQYQCADTLDHWPKYMAQLAGFHISHISVWKTPVCQRLRSMSEGVDGPQGQNTVASQVWPISFLHTYCIVAGVPSNQISKIKFSGYSFSWFGGKSNKTASGLANTDPDHVYNNTFRYSTSTVPELDSLLLPRRFGWLAGDVGYSFALPTVEELGDSLDYYHAQNVTFSSLSSRQRSKPPSVLNKFKKYIWLFGDSLIGTSTPTKRLESVLVANAVGVARMQHTKSNTNEQISTIKSLHISWGQHLSDGTPGAIFQTDSTTASNFLKADPRSPIPRKQTRAQFILKQPPRFWPFSGLSVANMKSNGKSPTSNRKGRLHDGNADISVKLIVLGGLVNVIEMDSANPLAIGDASLSFQILSYAVFVVNNPHDSPTEWDYSERMIFPTPSSGHYTWTTVVEAQGNRFAKDSDMLYLVGTFDKEEMVLGEIRAHDAFVDKYMTVSRIPASALLSGSLHLLQIACAQTNVGRSSSNVVWKSVGECAVPHKLFSVIMSEPTLHFDESTMEWTYIAVELTHKTVRKCVAPNILGPYDCSDIATISNEMWDSEKYFIYAGKAHPEIRMPARNQNRVPASFPLIVSYVPNTRNGPSELFTEETFGAYVPKFLAIESIIRKH